jgi:hypothetical protein
MLEPPLADSQNLCTSVQWAGTSCAWPGREGSECGACQYGRRRGADCAVVCTVSGGEP